MEAARNYLLQVIATKPGWRGVVPCTVHEPCRPVPLEDAGVRDALEDVIYEMFCTLYGSFGLGLAAPQVGIPWRLAVIDTAYMLPVGRTGEAFPRTEARRLVLINPEIVETAGEAHEAGVENCLSLPGHMGDVPRFARVRLKNHTPSGEEEHIDAGGFLGRVIQHEMDHLDGRTYPDRLSDAAALQPQTGGRFAGRAREAMAEALRAGRQV